MRQASTRASVLGLVLIAASATLVGGGFAQPRSAAPLVEGPPPASTLLVLRGQCMVSWSRPPSREVQCELTEQFEGRPCRSSHRFVAFAGQLMRRARNGNVHCVSPGPALVRLIRARGLADSGDGYLGFWWSAIARRFIAPVAADDATAIRRWLACEERDRPCAVPPFVLESLTWIDGSDARVVAGTREIR